MVKHRTLNRNEVVQGPSPEVQRALRRFDIKKASFYFDGYQGSSLRPELAKRLGIPEAQISVGYGIEFFLRGVVDGLIPGRDAVLVHEKHFTHYSLYAKTKNIRLATFSMTDHGTHFSFNIDDCIRSMRRERPKIVLVTSPNNPTGNSIALADIKRILHAANKNTLVVLDEAYHGFDTAYDEKGFLALVKKYPNILIVRGFSKEYALAGLRIGYALWGTRAKALARFDDLRLGGSQLLEHMGLAALRSDAYYKRLKKEIIADRKFFTASVNRMRLFKAYGSKANFVIVRVAGKAKKMLEKEMERSRVVIGKFVEPDLMRVSIGFRKNTAGFIAQMKKVERNVLRKEK